MSKAEKLTQYDSVAEILNHADDIVLEEDPISMFLEQTFKEDLKAGEREGLDKFQLNLAIVKE